MFKIKQNKRQNIYTYILRRILTISSGEILLCGHGDGNGKWIIPGVPAKENSTGFGNGTQ